MTNTRQTDRVYKLFYNSHGNWLPIGTTQTLATARNVKPAVKRNLKSRVIIRRTVFA